MTATNATAMLAKAKRDQADRARDYRNRKRFDAAVDAAIVDGFAKACVPAHTRNRPATEFMRVCLTTAIDALVDQHPDIPRRDVSKAVLSRVGYNDDDRKALASAADAKRQLVDRDEPRYS